jgi:hypothetical protein
MERRLDIERKLADYLYNDLCPEEIVEMEKELSSDPLLSEAYQLNMQVKEYLKAKVQLEEMRSDPGLEHAEELAGLAFDQDPHVEELPVAEDAGPKRKGIRKLTLAAAVAASVAVLVSMGIVRSQMDQDRLFDRYYAPMEASDYSRRGVENEQYTAIASAINQYRNGHYNQSIDQFSKLGSDPALRPEVQLFTALSYMGLGAYEAARSPLESLVDSNNRYQPEAMWYLSLNYLKTGEFEKAATLLLRLENFDGLYVKDARDLRRRIRRFRK